MFSFDQLRTVQIEITNRCQASCPMCLRNIHGGIDNPSLILTDWSLQQFQFILNQEVLKQIRVLDFCGDFGDPIINNDLIEMCRHVKNINPDAEILIHTNGSARSVKWWKELASVLPDKHKVVFALDGLDDTHSLYRIGTNFKTIIKNATAFIQAGGIAEWMFIRFKHNEHQVNEAKELSETIGFKSFSTKDSKRFGKEFPVLNSNGDISYIIEPPSNGRAKPVTFLDLKNYKEWKNDVDCFAIKSKELYIDANGYVMPCCIIGSFIYANFDIELYKKYNVVDETSILPIAREVQLEIFSIIQELGGLESLDSKIHPIKHIMNTELWENLLHQKWKDHNSSACKILCGGPYLTIQDQINK